MRLIQFENASGARQVAMVEGNNLQVVRGVSSTRELALAAIRGGLTLAAQVDCLAACRT